MPRFIETNGKVTDVTFSVLKDCEATLENYLPLLRNPLMNICKLKFSFLMIIGGYTIAIF